MTNDGLLPFQRMRAYVLSKELARRVHAAKLRDKALRDQATRAANRVFLDICEGLPHDSVARRREYFVVAKASLFETIGVMDFAATLGIARQADADAVQTHGVELTRILCGLLR
jgi:four helix bundle protein